MHSDRIVFGSKGDQVERVTGLPKVIAFESDGDSRFFYKLLLQIH